MVLLFEKASLNISVGRCVSVYISFLAWVSYFKQIHLHETYENNASFKRNGDMWKLQDMASQQPGHMRYFNAVWKKDAETMPAMHDLRNKHIPYLLWLQDQNVHKNNDAIYRIQIYAWAFSSVLCFIAACIQENASSCIIENNKFIILLGEM